MVNLDHVLFAFVVDEGKTDRGGGSWSVQLESTGRESFVVEHFFYGGSAGELDSAAAKQEANKSIQTLLA